MMVTWMENLRPELLWDKTRGSPRVSLWAIQFVVVMEDSSDLQMESVSVACQMAVVSESW